MPVTFTVLLVPNDTPGVDIRRLPTMARRATGTTEIFADGAVVPAGATVAVQGYPEVIRGGRVVANPTSDTDRVVRAGVGIDREGLVVFVVGVGSMYGFGQGALAAGLVELDPEPPLVLDRVVGDVAGRPQRERQGADGVPGDGDGQHQDSPALAVGV